MKLGLREITLKSSLDLIIQVWDASGYRLEVGSAIRKQSLVIVMVTWLSCAPLHWLVDLFTHLLWQVYLQTDNRNIKIRPCWCSQTNTEWFFTDYSIGVRHKIYMPWQTLPFSIIQIMLEQNSQNVGIPNWVRLYLCPMYSWNQTYQ
jgi:hypothetical protein